MPSSQTPSKHAGFFFSFSYHAWMYLGAAFLSTEAFAIGKLDHHTSPKNSNLVFLC